MFAAVGARLGQANVLASLGRLALLQNDDEEAHSLLQQARTLYQQINSRSSVAAQLGNFGWALQRLGQYAEAQRFLLEAVAIFKEIEVLDYAERHRQGVERMRQFTPQLHASAALAPGDEGQREEVEEQLAHLETRGWRLQAAAHAVWQGERNADALTAGLDDNSAGLIRYVLRVLAGKEE